VSSCLPGRDGRTERRSCTATKRTCLASSQGALAVLARLSTATAYVIHFRLLATAGATNLLLGVTTLGERLEARQLAGMALIGPGLAAIDGRTPRKKLRRVSLTR
jgi:multidrug transporter EmrE-like cation transporter